MWAAMPNCKKDKLPRRGMLLVPKERISESNTLKHSDFFFENSNLLLRRLIQLLHLVHDEATKNHAVAIIQHIFTTVYVVEEV